MKFSSPLGEAANPSIVTNSWTISFPIILTSSSAWRHVINAHNEQHADYVRHPIRDLSVPEDPKLLDATLATIAAAVTSGRPVSCTVGEESVGRDDRVLLSSSKRADRRTGGQQWRSAI